VLAGYPAVHRGSDTLVLRAFHVGNDDHMIRG
jgi:hypothetical protein